MRYECINPDDREYIVELMGMSIQAVAANASYNELGEARLHWNCCPACRCEFSSFPVLLEQVGPEVERCFATDLSRLNDDFTVKKYSILQSDNDDAYVTLLVELADAEWEVHQDLRRALVVAQHVYRGIPIEFSPEEREILSLSPNFVASLEPNVRHFVIAATLCFELLRPMWEKVGLAPRFDPRPREQILAELEAKLAAVKAGIKMEQPPQCDEKENLRRAIIESGLEPRVLWEIIESAAAGNTSNRDGAALERLSQIWRGDFDDFADFMKTGQMEIIRLSERSTRKASEYQPDVVAQLGSSLYSQLNETTQQLLTQAEFQYHLNSDGPNYFHGPVIMLAQAYETELMIRLAWPIARDLVSSGVRAYPVAPLDRKTSQRQLISEGQIQKKNMSLGSIAWLLRNDVDFREKVRGRGFEVDAIGRDAWAVVPKRDTAAHYPLCERAIAEDLRRLILAPDGILAHLHPSRRS
jgi:hypothetical protein